MESISLNEMVAEKDRHRPPSELRPVLDDPSVHNRIVLTSTTTDDDTELAQIGRGSPVRVLNPDIPDGGFGWVVVFAVFCIHFIVDGLTYSFGVIFPELLEAHNATKFEASWIFSILIGTTYGCGPIPSLLCLKFGRRPVAFLGGLIAFLGGILTIYATKIWHLAITFGFLTGLGFGCLYLPAVVSVNSWFEKRRARAVGIAVCGTGIGTIAMAPFSRYLLDVYDLTGCFFIYAGIILNSCVFAALLRPTPAEYRKKRSAILEENELRVTLLDEPSTNHRTENSLVKRSFLVKVRQGIDMDLIRKWKFWVFCLTAFFGGISSYIPYNFLPHRAETEAGIDPVSTAFLISLIGIANTIGRLASSLISDSKHVNRIWLYSGSCLVAGLGTCLSVFCYSYASYAAYALIYGFSGGIIIALQSVVLADIVGIEKLTAAFGLLLFIEGLAVYVGPPMAAFITDQNNGNYIPAFLVFGGLMATAGVSLLAVPINRFFSQRRRKNAAVVLVYQK